MKVEALNCPNCGGGVESDRTECNFCRTRLKTMACTSCLGLAFVGTRFCPHCGAIAAPIDMDLDGEEPGNCPRCRRPLENLAIGTTRLRGCGSCEGVWATSPAFESICADGEKRSAVLGYLQERRTLVEPVTKVNYVPCPDCGQLMNRSNFAKASGVIVDICKPHGVWFDADELPAIVTFIQGGGMELFRQRERNEIEQERAKMRAEKYAQDIRESRLGADDLFDDASVGTRLFVRRLFDI